MDEYKNKTIDLDYVRFLQIQMISNHFYGLIQKINQQCSLFQIYTHLYAAVEKPN